MRHTNLHFPSTNAKTLSGLIVDHLEEIPDGKCCFKYSNYIIEVISIALNIVMVIQLFSLYFAVSSMRGGGKEIKFYMLLILFLYIIVYGYFIYFVYKLSQNIKYDCLCAQSPIRFLLYAQAILIFIYLLFIIFGLINL